MGNQYKVKPEVVFGKKVLDEKFIDILLFCKKAVTETKLQAKEENRDLSQTIVNMNYINWERNNECLLYRIYMAKKFDGINGILVLLYKGDDLVALSGVEMWNENTVSLGKRAYTLKEYRNNLANTKHLMPLQIEWAKKNHPNAKLYIVTTNKYQKNHSFRSLKHWIDMKIDFWSEWKVYDGTLEFFGVQQYFVYNLLDKSIDDTKDNIKAIIEKTD